MKHLWICAGSLALPGLLMPQAFVKGAVIAVTAGGQVTEPTYQFSDSSGAALVTLVGSASKVQASADLETGSGNSVDTLAAQLATAQASIASLQAEVLALQNQFHLWPPVPGASNNCAAAQAGTTMSTHSICSGETSADRTAYDSGNDHSLDACKAACLSLSTCQAIQWQGRSSTGFLTGTCFMRHDTCATQTTYTASAFCMVIVKRGGT